MGLTLALEGYCMLETIGRILTVEQHAHIGRINHNRTYYSENGGHLRILELLHRRVSSSYKRILNEEPKSTNYRSVGFDALLWSYRKTQKLPVPVVWPYLLIPLLQPPGKLYPLHSQPLSLYTRTKWCSCDQWWIFEGCMLKRTTSTSKVLVTG